MKKIISLILSLVMVLSFTACGTKAEATWQEHYDLGLKYVNEAKYEEAILAFTKALEIDPKQAPVYIALAEVYVRQENYTAAQETLDKAITEIGETEELRAEKAKLTDGQLPQNNKGDTPRSHVPAPGGIPPQNSPASSADAVPGVVSTARSERGEGAYSILGIDAEGNTICQYDYNSDGSLEICVIYTYDTNGNEIRIDHYYSDGSPGFYYIFVYDANGNRIREDIYRGDGSLDHYWSYTYDASGNRTTTTTYNPDGTIME